MLDVGARDLLSSEDVNFPNSSQPSYDSEPLSGPQRFELFPLAHGPQFRHERGPTPITEDTVLERCSKCDTMLDVSECAPLTETICPHCAGMIKVLREFHHFMLLSPLGQGGAGAVYRAFDETLERDVALKLLRNEYTRDPEFIEALEREARATAAMNHANVVKVLSTGRTNGFFFIAMEIVGGGSLAQRIQRQGRLREREVISIAIQVAEGLRAAAQCGLLHRDVKPGNILYADQETVKVADFGLAMPFSMANGDSNVLWGTPDYIAPEKLLQEGEDIRSDIYSFGCTLFHCLTGEPPLDTATVMTVIRRQMALAAPNIQQIAPTVSGAMAFVIKRCLEKNPADRYQNYDELVEHLRYVETLPVGEGGAAFDGPSAAVHVEESAAVAPRRKSWGAWAAGAAMLALVGGAAAYVTRDNGRKADHAAAVREFTAGSNLLVSGDYADAAVQFHRSRLHEGVQPAMVEWSFVAEGVASAYAGDASVVRASFRGLQAELLQRNSPDAGVHHFLTTLSNLAASDQSIPAAAADEFDPKSYQAIGFLVLGLKDWSAGDLENAATLLQRFHSASVPEEQYGWIAKLGFSVNRYLDVAAPLKQLAERANHVRSLREKGALLAELQGVQGLGAAKAAELRAKVMASGPFSQVAYWKLDEGMGQRISDQMNAKSDGLVVGDAAWADGRFGKAFQFSGMNGIKINNPALQNLTRAITVAGWFRTRDTGPDWECMVRHDGHFTPLHRLNDGSVSFWLRSTGKRCEMKYPWIYGDGYWHHFASMYDSETGGKVYMDGKLVASLDVRGELQSSNTDFWLGKTEKDTEHYTGAMADIGVWNRALTGDEVRDLAAGKLRPDALP